MQQEIAAPEHLVGRVRPQVHGERPMLNRIERIADGVYAARNWPNIVDALRARIVLAVAVAGIAAASPYSVPPKTAAYLFIQPDSGTSKNSNSHLIRFSNQPSRR